MGCRDVSCFGKNRFLLFNVTGVLSLFMSTIMRFCLLFLLSGLVYAQEMPGSADLEPIPDGAPYADGEQNVPAPEVTIRQQGSQGSIEEYRSGGVLYMIKVNPAKGASYYLIDVDGDGNMETPFNDLQGRMMIPAWVLVR